ncbi:hypothetical protein JTP77_024000 [Streptomyces sp. S9]|nr:hypothetical protein [Streptomyces sp. S9]
MRPLLYGAVLALLWLVLGLPLPTPATVVQPVILAFAAGLLARPHLTGRRRTR